MDSPNEITAKLRAELKKELPEDTAAYDLWFRDMEVLRLTDRLLFLCVKTEVAQQSILRRYHTLIKGLVSRLYGWNVELIVYHTQDAPLPPERMGRDEYAYLNLGEEPENMAETANETEGSGEGGTDAGAPGGAGGLAERKGSPSVKYTFDNFIVGQSNRYAYTACKVVAEQPSNGPYNPLFLYGPPGIGKTHLLNAVTYEIKKRNSGANIRYVPSEQFTNEFIYAVQKPAANSRQYEGGKMHIERFKELYRGCDVLLIDDIQFLEGKTATVEEFFYTFNALFDHGKQIIAASDRHPREIDIEDRLISRFEAGLIVDIQPPDLELRAAIFKNKAEELGIEVPYDVLLFLAENITKNIRQIEGALKKLKAYSFFGNSVISLELAKNTLEDILSGTEPANVKIDRVIKMVSARFNVPIEDIRSKRRDRDIAQARFAAIYVIRTAIDLSYPAIGKIFKRDHSSVISAYNAFAKELDGSPALKAQINEIIKSINNPK